MATKVCKNIEAHRALDEGVSLREYIVARAGIHTLMHVFEARDFSLMIDVSQFR